MLLDAVRQQAILVVDDEPQVVKAIADILEDDYRIVPTTSADEALRAIEDKEIAVVMCDQRMPRMTGDELLSRAKKISTATRLLITGYADLQAVIRAVNEGNIFGYISKPWDPEALRASVLEAVQYHTLLQELEYERSLLRNLMQFSPDGIFFKSSQGRFLRANSPVLEFLGAENEGEIIGRSVQEILPPALARRMMQADETVLKAGRPAIDVEDTRVCADGRERWYSFNSAPILDRAARTVGLVGIHRDITDRKAAEKALRDSETRLRLLFASTAEAILGVDRTGRCAFSNPACVTMLGYASAGEMEGQDVRDLLYRHHLRAAPSDQVSDGQEADEERLRDAMAGGETLSLSGHQLWRKDGSSFPAHLWLHPVDEPSDALGAVITFFDVTVQKETERQLHQSQKMEAIGQLSGGIAHDFNNILGIVVGNLDLLQDSLPEGSPLAGFAGAAMEASWRGADLIKQLMAFSRRQELRPELIDLGSSLLSTLDLIGRTLGQGVRVERMLPADLWNVVADPSQLASAIMNLCVNARDAMPRGGTVTVEAENFACEEAVVSGGMAIPPGDYVRISVSDTGHGMPQHVIEHAFEPFFTTKEVGKGTGLGLSMVHGFMKQMGGHVTIHSQVGMGTTISLYLPRASLGGRPQGVRPGRREMPRGSGERILVVEDNDAMRVVTVQHLRQLGYRVVEARTAFQALELMAAGEPVDLVFTDVVLPGGMTGLDLAETLRSHQPDIRVILSSGFASRMTAENGRPAGSAHFPLITKPYQQADLAGIVHRVLTGER